MNIFNNLDYSREEISGLTFELKTIYINELFNKTSKSILIITNSLYEANKFYQSLQGYNDKVLLFPMDDFLSSEAIAVSPELKMTRLETINSLLNDENYIVVTNLMGLLRFLPTKDSFKKKMINLEVNKEYSIKKLTNDLFNLGYSKNTIVNKTGEMAPRGYVIDVFPISSVNPVRIEYWGDQIESIREFDINTQLTVKKLNSIQVNPSSEFLTDKDVDIFNISHRHLNEYTEVVSIKDYKNFLTVFNNFSDIEVGNKNLEEEIYNYNISENINANTKYMFDLYSLKCNEVKYFNEFGKGNDYNSYDLEKFPTSIDKINERLNSYLSKYSKVFLCSSSIKKANHLISHLENKKIIFTDLNNYQEKKINLVINRINCGFIYNNNVYVSENDIINNTTIEKKYKTNFKIGTKIKDVNKLTIGDYVVHIDHGIGKYLGIKSLEKNGLKKDYLLIEYKDSDKLYIPVEKIDLISKYSSKEGFSPRLNKLGTQEWEKTKQRTKKKIEDIAADLLKLYAIRESTTGFAYPKDGPEQIDFEREFEYEDTTDQLKVSEEIKKDMEKSSPMDRLLCGDVGYGKTEVAFRAIFKAVMGGKQTAILCPTTILSNQHFKNALDRFKSYPFNIALLNRFTTPKKVKEILNGVNEGKIDLLIGTHRILSSDVKFKNLGLLVIDEEQRFGVKHKEVIKKYKNNIDVLTLSATPIPRTLQMSMTGLRSLSLIETPPVDRYPIQTYVLAENNAIIKDVVYKELSRHGQCFILFNNIEKMESKRREILELIPDARIVNANGKMTKTELENIMLDFTNGLYDILLCTTIIETGIDIPNVNTLIIFDADRFGLSQLYQIRGRVGRSNRIAYCYLMYNKKKILSEVAIKRLNAIKEFTELGSGFSISMRDLAIRGAGDILGSEQAGFVDTVGIELFMQMLQEEIDILNGKKVEKKGIDSQPIIDVATSIDDNYVDGEELKIEIHRKINQIDSKEKLEKVKIELEDRFGKLSDDNIIYMYEEWLEKLANSLNIRNFRQSKNFIEIIIQKNILEEIDSKELFFGVSDISRKFRMSMRGNNLIITLDTINLDRHFVFYLIDLLLLIKNIKTK